MRRPPPYSRLIPPVLPVVDAFRALVQNQVLAVQDREPPPADILNLNAWMKDTPPITTRSNAA
jgi:hypothetical protein